jgi:hypothetical protein
MEFTSNNNKGMIWGLLEESKIFNGIENNKFTKIQSIMEGVINKINSNNSDLSLIEKNKMAMEEIIFNINKEKEHYSKSKKIQMIYTADDLQKQRKDNFSIKLKEQEENLNTYINPKKPEEPDFSDKNNNNDKPIGGEMDRLIAERMASRERELEVPKVSKEAEEWVNNSREIKSKYIVEPSLVSDKKVSFDLPETSNSTIDHTEILEYDNKNNIKSEVNNLFNKLKRKTEEVVVNTEINISTEFKILKETQNKLLQLCQQILEKMN